MRMKGYVYFHHKGIDNLFVIIDKCCYEWYFFNIMLRENPAKVICSLSQFLSMKVAKKVIQWS